MSKRLDSVVLQEWQYAAERNMRRTQPRTVDDLLSDEDLQDVVLRQLTIIGEAAARASEATRQHFPQVDWRRMVGMRHFVVHEYFRVDYATIWDAGQTYPPPLLAELPAIIAQVQAQEQRSV